MSLTVVALACLAFQKGGPGPENFNADQIQFAFRTGMDTPDLLARTISLARSGKGAEQQKAMYLLGRQYQRSYEKVFMAGAMKLDKTQLRLSYEQYRGYIGKWGSSRSEWLSDVRFYKAFFFLENNQLTDALNTLRDMKPDLDGQIYVDDLVWTQNRSYSILRSYDAGQLRDYFRDSISRHRDAPFVDVRVQAVATDLRNWCRSNRYKAAR